MVTVVN